MGTSGLTRMPSSRPSSVSASASEELPHTLDIFIDGQLRTPRAHEEEANGALP
eukprot:CAMPEP_0170584412 /NCGR_PEP_ID=MMETSP0224-20130122/8673_1 /TAXON_ID=285029 /ORGANISM="Togula jolla, Strain CCCM 725" /LENGTH=52 /DNA_ID=CAMNT_0010907841 /DNA_START=398 /DNA_END=556 /DNA_ORIENTATION=+